MVQIKYLLKSKIKFFNFLFVVCMLMFSVYADTNGIWVYSSDIKGGIFGSDEVGFTNYTFINDVYFNANVYFLNFFASNAKIDNLFATKIGVGVPNPQAAVDVAGKIYMRNETSLSDPDNVVVTKGYIDSVFDELLVSISSWYAQSWGACSVPCGGGIQTRVVDCRTPSGIVVDDKYCTDVKPATTQVCNTQTCEVNRCWDSPSDVRYTSYVNWLHNNYGMTSWENCHGQCIWRCGRKGSKAYCTSNYPDKSCRCVAGYQLTKTGTMGTATLYECLPVNN